MSNQSRHDRSIFGRFEADANGCLTIGGQPLTRLAQRVGDNPFFAYSRDLISRRVAELRDALPAYVGLSYAIKANPMPAVVQHLATLVDGFDVASAAEMNLALDTTMGSDRISFAGPGKSDRELIQAIAAGVLVNVESENELRRAAALGRELGIAPRVAIRVNPAFEVKASGMQMGGGPKAFGIDAERTPDLLRTLPNLNIEFGGLHIFSGSQNLSAEALVELHRGSVALAIDLARSAPVPIRKVNIGAGFGIPYFPGDEPVRLGAVAQELLDIYARLSDAVPGVRIVLELGRYLVGEAGIYVCRIRDRKQSRGKTYLVTDGGLHHHLAASGNFGQVVRRNYPIVIGNRMTAASTEIADVVGCLCTPIDVLARNVALPHAEVGDYVVVLQSGAYGLSASPTGFLSHPSPLEVLI